MHYKYKYTVLWIQAYKNYYKSTQNFQLSKFPALERPSSFAFQKKDICFQLNLSKFSEFITSWKGHTSEYIYNWTSNPFPGLFFVKNKKCIGNKFKNINNKNDWKQIFSQYFSESLQCLQFQCRVPKMASFLCHFFPKKKWIDLTYRNDNVIVGECEHLPLWIIVEDALVLGNVRLIVHRVYLLRSGLQITKKTETFNTGVKTKTPKTSTWTLHTLCLKNSSCDFIISTGKDYNSLNS